MTDIRLKEAVSRLEELALLSEKMPEGYTRVVKARQSVITEAMVSAGLDPADPLHRRGVALGLALVGHPWGSQAEAATTIIATLKPTVEGS